MKLKVILLLVLAFVVPAVCASAGSKSGKSRIRFEKYRHDFGTVKEKDGPVSCEFVFYNDGDAPLVITEATALCGCTRPEFTDKPVAPGKKGKVKVTYNPLGRPGHIDRTVTVRTNGNPKKVTLKIVGFVGE